MNIPINDYIIVCVSQLRREKAHTNLLDAASKLEQRCNLMPQMVLVRDGAERIRRFYRVGVARRESKRS